MEDNLAKAVAESTLSLLDDIVGKESRNNLEQFLAIDELIEKSLAAAVSEAESLKELELSSEKLNPLTSKQKLQNESLIQALKDLHTRMDTVKLKSGKVIPST